MIISIVIGGLLNFTRISKLDNGSSYYTEGSFRSPVPSYPPRSLPANNTDQENGYYI